MSRRHICQRSGREGRCTAPNRLNYAFPLGALAQHGALRPVERADLPIPHGEHVQWLERPECANPRGGSAEGSYDPAQPQARSPRKVVKGRSFLCAPNYWRRYRPAARHAQMVDSGMSHIGFRCVGRAQ
jgi:hypothetical protein